MNFEPLFGSLSHLRLGAEKQVKNTLEANMKKEQVKLFIIIALGLMVSGGATTAIAQGETITQAETDNYRRSGPCSDPWVTAAIIRASSGTAGAQTLNGTDGDCDISRYNNGSWTSFASLVGYVRDARNADYAMGVEYERYDTGAGKLLALMDRNAQRVIAMTLVGNDGASVIGNDAGSIANVLRMVAAGGGNMVAAGGGNLKALMASKNLISNMGRVLPTAGGNLISNISPDMLSINFEAVSGYGLAAGKARSIKMAGRSMRLKKCTVYRGKKQRCD
jgi:hypothetical protein